MAARTFAHALGTVLAQRHPELTCAPRLLITSSPYSYVPTAANTLARCLRQVLNEVRTRCGLAEAPLVQVDRTHPSSGDYGTLSASARDQLMAVNDLSFRRFAPRAVRDAELLIVDDVRVTGAHQRCLVRASDSLPLAGRTFVYIASFGIPASGRVDPTQEDALNHAAIRSLGDLATIVRAGDFAWNVRVCKFVLDPANRGDLPRFLALMPGWFVRDLHRNSCRDGYAQMNRYSPSHAMVGSEMAARASTPGRIPPCQIPLG
jgi:PRTase ComF-like